MSEQTIKVNVDAIVKGIQAVRQLNSELAQAQKAAKTKLDVSTGGAEGALGKLIGFFKGTSDASSQTGASLAALAGPVGAAVGALTAAAGAASSVGAAIFGMAKAFSDAGSDIFDLSQKTSFSTEGLSTLKVAAEQSGSTLQDVGAGLVKFEKALVEASQGNKELSATFKALGVDVKQGLKDPEQAFSQFIKTFNQIPEGAQKTELALKLFGKAGANLIPTFDALEGNFERAKQRAAELGLVFDKDAAKAADDFGDTLTLLGQQGKGLINTFGREVAPGISQAMKDVSDGIRNNKEKFQEWGRAIADVFSGIKKVFSNEVVQEILSGIAKIYEVLQLQTLITALKALRLLGSTGASSTSANASTGEDPFGPGGAARGGSPGMSIGSGQGLTPEQKKLLDELSKAGGSEKKGAKKKTPEEEAKDLLANLKDELNRVGTETKVAAVTAELLKGKYDGLKQATRDLILAEAAKIDQANASKAAMELLKKTGTQAAESLFELSAGADGSITDLERFDNALAQIPESARPAQAEIDKVRQALQNVIDRRAEQELQKKTRAMLDAIFNLRQEAQRELGNLGFDTSTNLGKLLDSVSRIEGANVPIEKLRALVDVFKQLGNIRPVLQQDFAEKAITNLGLAKPPNVSAKDWQAFLQYLSEASLAAQQLDDTLRDQSAKELYESTLRSLNEELRQGVQETSAQRLEYELTTGTLKSLNEEQKKLLRAKAEEADAVRRAREEQEKQRKAQEDFIENLRQLSQTIVGIFDRGVSAFRDGWKAAFKSVLFDFIDLLKQMALAVLESELLKLLAKIFKIQLPQQQGSQGGGSGNVLLDILGKIFRRGGGQQSGGNGVPVDTTGVPLGNENVNDTLHEVGHSIGGHVDQGAQGTIDSIGIGADRTVAGLSRVVQAQDNTTAAIRASTPEQPSFGRLLLATAIQVVGQIGGAYLTKAVSGSKQYAAGGHVLGPGSETSDSIPARLSNWEFVQPARAVKHYGLRFMEAVRTLRLPRGTFSLPSAESLLGSFNPSTRFANGGLALAATPPLGTMGRERDGRPDVNVILRPDAQGRIRSKSQISVEYLRGAEEGRRNL